MSIIESNILLLILVVVFGFIFFYHIDYNTLASWDEAWYASIARSMFQSGKLLKLDWNGMPG